MKNKVTQEMCMIDIPHHPKIEELSRTLFGHYWFRKDKKYHCSNCGSIYEEDWAGCPNCHVRGEDRLITKRTNFDNLTLEYRAEVFQAYQGLIVVRQYSIIQRIVNLRELIEFDEIERTVIYQGEIHQFFHANQDYQWTWSWRSENGWLPGRMNENNRKRRPKQTYTFLPNSFEQALKETEVKYTLIGKYIDDSVSKYKYSIERYISIAAANPWIEYVYKIGGVQLYSDIVNGCADMRIIRKKSIKEFLPYIKKENPNANKLCIKIWSIRNKAYLSDEFIESMIRLVGGDRYIKDLYRICLITQSNVERLYQYLEKQGGYIAQSIHTYRDYIDMMTKIDCKPNTDLLIYPKSLKKAHDDAVMKFNTIQQQANNEVYNQFKNDLQKLSYKNSNFTIIIPDRLEDILQEGQMLNHCVGSYINRVMKKQTIILFVRKVDDQDSPYYTVEYRDKRVIQCRGFGNVSASEEVKGFLEEWESWLLKPKQKKARVQPSQQMALQG